MKISKLWMAVVFVCASAFGNTHSDGILRPMDDAAFVGLYKGMFGGSPISIYLETVNNGQVIGYNIHRDVKRPLSGSYEAVSGASYVKFILKEPGDGEYDGNFEMLIDTLTFSGNGTWVPKPQSKLSPISFAFAKEK